MTTYLAQANTGADALASVRTVTKPAAVGAGAVGVFWLVRWHESGSFPAVTPPAGAVLRGTITTTSMQTQCYLHRVTAETSFAYSWTSGRWCTLAAVWFSGVDPAADLATVPFQSATGSGTAIGTLTVTSNVDSALAWHVNTIDTSGVTHTPPTGFTEVADASPAASAYRITVASGSQTADGATVSPTTAWAAGLVALPPAPTGGTTGAAALIGTAVLGAAGARSTTGAAGLAGTAALVGTGTRRTSGGANLAATATRTAAGTRSAASTATLPAAAALTADGLVSSHATSAAALEATAAIDATGQTAAVDGTLLEALAVLTGDGQRTAATNGSIDGTVGLAAAGLTGHSSQAVLDATAELAADGQRGVLAGAGLAGEVALAADGTLGAPPAVGAGVLAATAALTAAGTAAVVSGAGLAATAVLTVSGTTSGSSDDIEVTVGAPYSRWTAGQPQPSPWAALAPRAGEWKAGAPW
ncbi:hypothetical protein ACFU5D_16575 [Streptomyces anthocyanicus]|uniref:hypothetical protein n=1 Tax=Streptomyces anthocyanicus TaxID=68174 RepID=UPI0036ADEEDA